MVDAGYGCTLIPHFRQLVTPFRVWHRAPGPTLALTTGFGHAGGGWTSTVPCTSAPLSAIVVKSACTVPVPPFRIPAAVFPAIVVCAIDPLPAPSKATPSPGL